MTDIDIPALIEEADKALAAPVPQSITGPTYHTLMISATAPGVFISRDMLRRMRDALSLCVSPLPEKIAELCTRLRHPNYFGQEGMRAEAAAVLERMAREIQRLEHRLEDEKHVNRLAIERYRAAETELEDCNGVHQRAQVAAARIRELEAERDASRSEARRLTDLCAEARADRDAISKKWASALVERDTFQHQCKAIKAKTIEECVEAVYWFYNVERWSIADVANRIRALMPAGDGKENP